MSAICGAISISSMYSNVNIVNKVNDVNDVCTYSQNSNLYFPARIRNGATTHLTSRYLLRLLDTTCIHDPFDPLLADMYNVELYGFFGGKFKGGRSITRSQNLITVPVSFFRIKRISLARSPQLWMSSLISASVIC